MVRFSRGLGGETATRRAVSLSFAIALSMASAPALADSSKAQCIEANTKGQELRRDAKLSASKEQFRACAAPSCPALLRDDCTRRLDEIDKVQPTIVFVARDASGNDVSAVKVTVDGKPLAEKLDGTDLAVDPGEHVFTFTAPGQPPFSKKLVLAAGDKDRREHLVIGSPEQTASSRALPAQQAPAPAPAATVAPNASSPSGGMGTQKILGVTAAGVGIAGIAVGSVFGLLASSAYSQQKTDCASPTDCSNHAQAVTDHSTMSTDGTISTVAFAAGGVLLAAGAVLYFTAHGSTETGASALAVAPTPGGGSMTLLGAF